MKRIARTHLPRCGTAGAVAIVAGALLSGCGGGGTIDPPPGQDDPRVISYDFHNGKQGWVADFSDLPANYNPADYELGYTHANLPPPLDTARKALRLHSHNRSDDLWYFIKQNLSGLRASTSYRVCFDLELASDAAEQSFGIGGGPGASVVVKAGASPVEPKVTVAEGRRQFNLDKGEQSQGGRDVVILGNIAIPGDQPVYRLKQLDNAARPFTARTDSAGRLWAFVGTESGFEGRQAVYFTRLKLTLTHDL